MNLKTAAFLSIVSVLLTTGCRESGRNKVSVHGAVSKLGPSELYVTYTDRHHKPAFDTLHATQDGKFEFDLTTDDNLTPVTIYFASAKCWTTLFANPGDRIHIGGSIDYVDLLNIKGGLVNDDLNRFKMQIRNLYRERIDLLKGSYTSEDAAVVRLAEINLLLKRAAKEFIRENPSSIASVVLIQDFFYQDYDPLTEELLGLLEGKASTCPLADKIREGLHVRN